MGGHGLPFHVRPAQLAILLRQVVDGAGGAEVGAEDLRPARDIDARPLVRTAQPVDGLAGIACHDHPSAAHQLQRLEVNRGEVLGLVDKSKIEVAQVRPG